MSSGVRRTGRLRAILAVAAFVGASCSGAATRPSATPEGGAVRPGGTSVVGGTGEPANGFNPKNPKSSTGAVIKLMTNVWPSVWQPTPGFGHQVDAELIVHAEMTGTDPQTVVYRINPQAEWSDGVPVTAADFDYDWQASPPGAKDIDGSPLQGSPISTDPISSVTGTDDGRTVTVAYRSRFRQWQTRPFNYLVPAHVAKRVGWNSGFDTFDPAVIVSAGPFRIAGYAPGQDVTIVRNERYWGRPADLERIVLRAILGPELAAAFRNGEIDVIDAFEPTEDLLGQMRGLPGGHGGCQAQPEPAVRGV